MLPAPFDKNIEDAVGLFAIALSFASDGGKEATTLASFCDFHDIKCYEYRRFQARQLGMSLRSVASFIYLTTPNVIVFNTPDYLHSQHTVQEFELIRRSAELRRLVIIELGGRQLPLINLPVEVIQGFSSEAALGIIQHLR